MDNYDSIRQRARAAKSCPSRHSCGRFDHIMLETRTGRVSDECEVWDGDYHDESDTSEVIFGGTKADCIAHIAQLGNGSRYSLVEQGMCATCDLYDARKAAVAKGKQPSFLIVVTGVSRHYGGPEEGGWWYNRQEVLEVRKAYTCEQGLRHARELREEYPQPKYGIGSCANRGEPETHVRCVYSESDPRFPQEYPTSTPRYE